MADPVPAQAHAIQSKIGFGQVAIRGRLESSRKYDGKYLTVVISPAVDEWSKPQYFELRSDNRLGEKDELITVRARAGGYKKSPYAFTDKETGERKTIVPINHSFDVIED